MISPFRPQQSRSTYLYFMLRVKLSKSSSKKIISRLLYALHWCCTEVYNPSIENGRFFPWIFNIMSLTCCLKSLGDGIVCGLSSLLKDVKSAHASRGDCEFLWCPAQRPYNGLVKMCIAGQTQREKHIFPLLLEHEPYIFLEMGNAVLLMV